MIMNQKHRHTRFIAFTVVVFVTGCCCSLTFKCTNLSRYKCVSSKNVSSSIEGGDHFTAVNVQTFYICHFCSFLVVFGLVRHSPSAVMHYLLMRLKLSQICSVYFSFFFFSTYGHELLCQTNWLIFKPVIKCFGCRLKQKYFELGQWKKIYIYIYILSKGDNNGIILFVLLHSNTHLAGKAGAAIAIRTFQDVYHKSLKTLYTRGEAPLQHRSPPVWLQRTQNK